MHHRDFWNEGYKVFPLYGVLSQPKGKRICECGNPDCKALFKHPRNSNWQHTPLWDEEQIDAMEEYGRFSSGYGVLCQGLLVIDVDARNGGVESFKKLVNDFPDIIQCGLIVETGSGNGSSHRYFSLKEPLALIQSHEDYPGIDFKSSGFVVGPGSNHASGNQYRVSYGSPGDIEPPPAGLLDFLRKPERHRAVVDGGHVIDVSHQDVADMLSYIPNLDSTDYDTWIKVGMAIHHVTNGTGDDLWRSWSEKSAKHDPSALDYKWHSFGKSANPVTAGTLIYHAEQNGWRMPVTFTPQVEFDLPEDVQAKDGLPMDIAGVDLTKPPGFVGDVTEWINEQCEYPRARLSAMSAILAIGNVGGLRHCADDIRETVPNIMLFCVADSATGKDDVWKATSDIHQVAGMSGALHGGIKSEKEIIQNLIEHQAAFYNIDELGERLKQLENSQKNGGAAYLQGVIAAFLSLYSKSGSYYLVTGDVRREIRAETLRQISSLQKAIEENDDPTGAKFKKSEDLKKRLNGLDLGLEKPFFSLIGYSTNSQFNETMSVKMAENGFLGRAILCIEREGNPRPNKRFTRRAMPEAMKMQIMQIAHGGDYDHAAGNRIENYGPKVKVRTTQEATQALAECRDWFLEYAEAQKSISGLVALPRRGFEKVAKISTILAIPSGVRTLEHVRWAFACAKHDIDEKITAVMSNDDTSGKQTQLKASILKHISTDHGESIAVLSNKMRKYRKEDIETAMTELLTAGIVREERSEHPSNKKTVVKFFGC